MMTIPRSEKWKARETSDYHGVIMYQIVDDKFTEIKVAYLNFTRPYLE